ncbi:hypothetical protein [Clostridium sp.]|uniref:hypothetical protein n=1 Tax=Clostridium sp. TaxID=1506 RepID=UPI0028477C94|nr:hypothetical protein [Clostridium sp.]MDR3596906.1 hypothetical protein [Clostridium sp.]
MDIGTILILSLLLFVIIYFSVRLAINPLLNKTEKIITENNDVGLVKLRDIEILSDAELEQVIKLYKNKSVEKKDYEQYQKYEKVLNELKEIEYLSVEQYSSKVNKLKRYFKVD